MPQIYHNASLTEDHAVFAFSVLSLKQKCDYVRRSIQVQGYLLLFVCMASLMLKVALTSASILLFASIALLVFNLIRENSSLRSIQQQITRLCDSTQYQQIVHSSDDSEWINNLYPAFSCVIWKKQKRENYQKRFIKQLPVFTATQVPWF